MFEEAIAKIKKSSNVWLDLILSMRFKYLSKEKKIFNRINEVLLSLLTIRHFFSAHYIFIFSINTYIINIYIYYIFTLNLDPLLLRNIIIIKALLINLVLLYIICIIHTTVVTVYNNPDSLCSFILNTVMLSMLGVNV